MSSSRVTQLKGNKNNIPCSFNRIYALFSCSGGFGALKLGHETIGPAAPEPLLRHLLPFYQSLTLTSATVPAQLQSTC